MKIAIFTDCYIPEINGVVTSIKNFTELLAAEGHEIVIFCPKYRGYRDKDIPKNIRILRYPSFSFITNKETKLSFPSLAAVLDKLREFQPDIIHIQTPMNMGVTGLWAAKTLGIKNIQTYHTYIPDFMVYLKPKNIFGLTKISEEVKNSRIYERIIASDLGENFSKAGLEIKDDIEETRHFFGLKKKPGPKKADMTTKFAWNFTRFLYNRADMVLTPSHALKKELVKHGVKAPVNVQSNGIELGEFKVKTDYSLKNKIIHIGRLGPEKNVDVLLKAFAEMAKNNKSIKLDIMGDGPSKKQLMKLARDLKINNQVRFLGFVDRKRILETLKDYDLFVTASTIETQGLVILESMASGLPIVGVDKLAIPEVVKNCKNGYIVKPGDFKKMARAIERILASEKECEKMGKASLEIVKQHELTLMAKKLEKYYLAVSEKALVSAGSK